MPTITWSALRRFSGLLPAGQPALAVIDARFDEKDPALEEIRIPRLPAILSATACPAAQ